MSNSTIPASMDYDFGVCDGVECPDGKLCVEDDKEETGYKCCKNRKCVIKCKDPGRVLGANRIPDVRDFKFTPKEKVYFTCQSGYYPSPSGVLVCGEDGAWSGPIPECVPIKPMVPAEPDVTSPKTTTTTPSGVTGPKIMTTTPPSPGLNSGVIAIAFLIPILFLVVGVLFFLRYRDRTHRHISLRCRKRSNPEMFENHYPKMPENLEEGAVAIKDFAQYVAMRHNNADRLFREEFEEIQQQTSPILSWETSLLDENKEKNRYTNIVAYDHTRVRLNRGKKHRRSSGTRYSDYINANFVSSFERPEAYIACQGPLPETFADFWKMIWENNVTVIVMITNLVERGRRKCDRYWPQEGREQYKHLSVTLRDVDMYANYTVRTFQLRDTKQSKRRSYNNERRVLQFHYTQWPDHGTPEYILPLLTFIHRSSQANNIETAPIVVHCSAGVGRTGAYIMLHSMVQMALKTGKININKFLRFIRTQRNHLVQTEDQYTFLHDALLCRFTCGNTGLPAQQLNAYVQSLLAKPAPSKKSGSQENGVKTSESLDPKLEPGLAESYTGMERQFMIVARQIVRDIDYDFAKREVNQSKNRSNGILPVFRSRVPLHYRIGSEGSDYINASFLQGYRNGKMFIVTQLPMGNTRKDFWSLVWDQNCSVIITIRDNVWDDSLDVYWPTGDKQVACPLFNVSAEDKNVETKKFGDIEVTKRGFVLEATKDDYVLAVTQVDIASWPMLDELKLEFTQLLEYLVRLTENKDGSVIVQDRFGGKTAGQLACAYTLHQQLANENAVDVFQTVRVAYQMRPEIFKSHKDLHFLYKTMLLQTNPGQYRASVVNNEKVALHSQKSAPTSQIGGSSDKAPLISGDTSDDTKSDKVATGSATTETSQLPNDKSGSSRNSVCDIKKDSENDNDSHYDLIDDVTSALQAPESDDADIENSETVAENSSNNDTLHIESELDNSVTSTAKLIN